MSKYIDIINESSLTEVGDMPNKTKTISTKVDHIANTSKVESSTALSNGLIYGQKKQVIVRRLVLKK